ncbi:hypothetical protein IPG41_06005 [Candidatus Peregrinibacteria bacterium]|nr:MAG: hypothetical protein IPG41_06005 [Candidatus Peregrinibacteria bacterium]
MKKYILLLLVLTGLCLGLARDRYADLPLAMSPYIASGSPTVFDLIE